MRKWKERVGVGEEELYGGRDGVYVVGRDKREVEMCCKKKFGGLVFGCVGKE